MRKGLEREIQSTFDSPIIVTSSNLVLRRGMGNMGCMLQTQERLGPITCVPRRQDESLAPGGKAQDGGLTRRTRRRKGESF